jgi:hypothetical protein
MKATTIVLFLLAVCFSSTGQVATGSISDVSFIEGRWQATPVDRAVDAFWSAPGGGTIAGYVRVIKEGKVALYELFAFEETPAGLVVLVKHFKPGLIGVEEKDKADHYKFVESGPGRALFEKTSEPVRVLYEKRGENQFAIVIGKPENGNWVFKDFWVFSRVK